MSEYERTDRLHREPTVDDVRQLMGASTPHFALQLRNRIRTLIGGLPPDHPARVGGRARDRAARPDRARLGAARADPGPRGGPAELPRRPSSALRRRATAHCSTRSIYGGAMAWEFNVLVVANVTATSDELLAALRERADRGACRFTLLMPREGTDTHGAARAGPGGDAGRRARERERPDGRDAIRSSRRWRPGTRCSSTRSWSPRCRPGRRAGWGSTCRAGSRSSPRCRSITSCRSRPRSSTGSVRRKHESYGVLSPLAAALNAQDRLSRRPPRLLRPTRGPTASGRRARGARSRCPRAGRRPSPASGRSGGRAPR